MLQGDIRIALLHDELIRRGGAEIVFEELVRIFPQADVYALYAGRPRLTVDNRRYPIHTTFLQNFPGWFRRHPRRLLPLLPYAAELIDLSQYDVVISSASAFVKGVVTRANIPHICYAHTPTRYLWEPTSKNQPATFRWPAQALLHYLRLVDYSAAQRVTTFIANSTYTQERIAKYYRRESAVVYPPIDTTFFHPAPVWQRFPQRDNAAAPFLVVGRLSPAKYFHQAIIACEKLQQPLVVIGTGPHLRQLQRLAGKHTTFIGKVSREELRQWYRRSRALLQPGVEDFGMAAAEAQACGTPVIAYGRGGIREIVAPGESGYLYHAQRVEALAEAVRRFIASNQRIRIEQCQRQALRFSKTYFRENMLKIVADAVAQHRQIP